MANNPTLYNAVICGATGGIQARWLSNADEASYDVFRIQVVNIAEQVDTLIATTDIGGSASQLMQSIAQGVFADRFPTISDFTEIAATIVALYTNLIDNAALDPIGDILPLPPGLAESNILFWDDTAKKWIAPSADVATLDQALVWDGSKWNPATIGGGGDLALGGVTVVENFNGAEQLDTGNPGVDPGIVRYTGIGTTNLMASFIDCDAVDAGWRTPANASEPGMYGSMKLNSGSNGSIANLIPTPYTPVAGSTIKPFTIEQIQELTLFLETTSAADSAGHRTFFGICDNFDEENRGGDWIGIELHLDNADNWQYGTSDVTGPTLIDTGVPGTVVKPYGIRLSQRQAVGGLGNGNWDIYVQNFTTPVLSNLPGGLAALKRVDIGVQMARLDSGGTVTSGVLYNFTYKLFSQTFTQRITP